MMKMGGGHKAYKMTGKIGKAKYGKMMKAKSGTMVMARGQKLGRKKPTKIC